MFSILKIMRQRRWATMLAGVVLLVGGSVTSRCFTLFAKDDSTYEKLEKRIRDGQKFRGPEFDTLSESDRYRLKQLYRNTLRPIDQSRAFSPTPSPNGGYPRHPSPSSHEVFSSDPSHSPPPGPSNATSANQLLVGAAILFLGSLVAFARSRK